MAPGGHDTPSPNSALSANKRLDDASAAVYSTLVENAVVAHLEFLDYDEINLFYDPKIVLTVLQRLHALLDKLTEKHHLYKVDGQGGRLSVAGNVSETIDNAADEVLSCLTKFMTLAPQVKTPYRRRPTFRAAVSAGTVVAAVLGTTAMRFGVFGPCEVVTRTLLRYAPVDSLVASEAFIQKLSPSAEQLNWQKLVSVRLPDNRRGTVEVFRLDSMCMASESSGDSTTDGLQGALAPELVPSRFRKWGLSMKFPDPDTEHQFRLYQGARLMGMDGFHLVVSLMLMQTAVVRCFQLGFPSTMAISLTLGALLATAAPLFAMSISKDLYLEFRTLFMTIFRLFRVLAFVFYNYTAPGVMLGISHQTATFFSRTLIVNLSIVHGMYAIGAQVVLQWHTAVQLFVLAAVGFNSYLACKEDKGDMLPECSRSEVMALSLVMQFLIMFLIPTALVWRVERLHRKMFAKSYLEQNLGKDDCKG